MVETDEFDVDDDSSIDWITNDKYIHIEDNTPSNHTKHAIYYKLGIDRETGDGVLARNTITKQNGNETEEKMLLY